MNNPKQPIGHTGITRRSLLKAGLATAAGTIFCPYLARSNPLGANGRIRMALIGWGNIGRVHQGWAQSHPGIELLAVCDVRSRQREAALRSLRETNPTALGYVDYGDIMARNDIDAVIVCTPDHWHAAISIDAMRTGKDVYVEKPMALTIAEASAMAEAEKRYGRILQVGSQQRSEPDFRQVVNIVRNGWIGGIREIQVDLGGDFPPEKLLPAEPVPADIDYDRWLGPAPAQPYNASRVRGWRMFWDYGWRRYSDWGAHHFDIVQWALGMDGGGPVHFVPKGFDGAPQPYYQYPDGLKVTMAIGEPGSPAGKFMIRFVGTEGEVGVSRELLESTPPTLAAKTPSSREFRADESNSHRDNWLDSIISRRPTLCPASVGARTFDICALAGLAQRLGRPVRWNPAKREIVDDPQAARFAEYPRRAGYPLPV